MDFRRSIATRQTKRAAASASYRPSDLGPPTVGALRFDARLRTAGEVVALMLRAEAIGAAPQQEKSSAAARDLVPYVVSGEAKSETFSAVTVGAWKSTKGALSWVD